MLILSTLSISCDKKKIAREALKASQDIQLSVNGLARTLKAAQDNGTLALADAAKFRPILTEITNANEFLNERSIEWARLPELPAEAQNLIISTIQRMLDQLTTLDALTLLHVKNEVSQRAIRALSVAIKSSLDGVSLLIISGKGK